MMKFSLILIVAIMASMACLQGMAKASDTQTDTKAITAEVIKDFTLEDLNGNKVTLSELKGKKILLNFWATWCPPCRREMPDMEKVYQENKANSDFVILAVNLGEKKETVQAFVKANNYNFLVLSDADKAVAKEYNIMSIPTSIFINSDGSVLEVKDYNGNPATRRVGSMSYEEMSGYVKALK